MRRYVDCLLPFAHFNGKLANWDYCCRNQADSNYNGNSFVYGYKHKTNPASLYGYRSRCRNLSTNPYTYKEEQNRSLFIDAIQQAAYYINNRVPAKYTRAFIQQRRYKRLYTFLVATLYYEFRDNL